MIYKDYFCFASSFSFESMMKMYYQMFAKKKKVLFSGKLVFLLEDGLEISQEGFLKTTAHLISSL